MPVVRVATTQFAAKGDDAAANVAAAEDLVRAAAARGAQLVLLQELFVGRYFCQEQRETHFESALSADPGQNHLLAHQYEGLIEKSQLSGKGRNKRKRKGPARR